MPDLYAALATTYGTHARQAIDVFVPTSLVCPALTVICHGGWWTNGRAQDLRPFALHLSELGFPTAIIGTRLLGDGARNGQDIIEDVKVGVAKALDEAAIHGASDHSLLFLGSGSGTLTALTTAMQFYGDPRIRVRGLVACGVTPTLEAWEGCSPTVARTLELFAGNVRHIINPMELPADQLPPLLLLHGDNDQDVPARLAQRLHARAIEADTPSQLAVLSGLGHRFIEQPFERTTKSVIDRIIPFLSEYGQEPESASIFSGKIVDSSS